MRPLLGKQHTFITSVARLILWAEQEGYQMSEGEAYRTAEQSAWNFKQGKGIENSLHRLRLAIDLNLFKNGDFLIRSEDYAPLGEYWKSLHSEFRWGGDFDKPDGNHFSMEHEGVK